MGSDDELSDDEEEILVYVEFEGLVDGNVFSEEQLQLDMIGMDSEHPILQINGRFYEGTYEDVNGTYMFFIKDDNYSVNDPVFDAITNLKYFAKTRKFLKMQRVFIKPRTEVLGDSEHYECIPNLNMLKQAGIPLRYHEQALSFWNTVRNNRLNALHIYLEKQRVRQQKRSQGIMLESESDEDNPFAIYKHKEECNNLSKSGDCSIEFEKDSSHYNNQLYFKPINLNEKITETQDPTKDTSQDNFKGLTALVESQSSISNDESCYSVKSTKPHKTKVSRKKNTCVTYNVKKIKRRTKRVLSKNKVTLPNTDGKELPNEKNKVEKLDKSNVIEALSTLEITENENEKECKQCKITPVEESKIEVNQMSSTNSKIVKQCKREAKMKEISQRLKAIAEEHFNINAS